MEELDFVSRTPIKKGWSEDKKYHVTDRKGGEYLLRISPLERYETRRALFQTLQRVAALDVPMCRPVAFGTCREGVYTLHTWIRGRDAEDVIPALSPGEQYCLGVRSGEILRRIHTIPAPGDQEDWGARFGRKTDLKIEKYLACPLRFSGDQAVIAYLRENRGLLRGRPRCFQHGDYHVGNMMMAGDQLYIIDFDRFDFGDPWEEFNRIVWCAQSCPSFAAGQLDGYFGGRPPLEFFRLLAYYIASNTLSSIYWAIPFGQDQVDVMMAQAKDVLNWYEGMKILVPRWYQ